MKKGMGLNKKGADNTIWIVIVVIVALFLLFMLIFSGGNAFTTLRNIWDNFWGGGKVNIDSVIAAGCTPACDIGKKTEYCETPRKVVFEEKAQPELVTCDTIAKRYPSKLGCDKFICDVQLISCQGLLERECINVPKCSMQVWLDKTSLDNFNIEKGPGKRYADVIDLTPRVTDLSEKNANIGRFCVKLVEN